VNLAEPLPLPALPVADQSDVSRMRRRRARRCPAHDLSLREGTLVSTGGPIFTCPVDGCDYEAM